jgi:hypothetical protein
MKANSFSKTLITNRSPEEVFHAVNNVRLWWTGYYSEKINGDSQQLNDEFTFSAGDGVHFSKQKLIEVIPGKKIVWLISEANLSFVEKPDEWVGTKVIFTISKKGDKTELIFTHEGLTPDFQCYEGCAPAWTQYLDNKLLPLINSGTYANTI